MIITKNQTAEKISLALKGRLGNTTAAQLENEILLVGETVSFLELNFDELEYISSAGLRVILSAQKKMSPPRTLLITGVNETIMEVFEITGFADILTIEG
ncbi:STAS domain-containing protein [Acetobacterium woodii]|uniref:Putative anti-sigma factor antagonist n=1 Tax=Acetobacterium woodii (strain ATCC 29683 / DSM 1030 / JCM 2381 / KCTC 1655 / WB1) TaxID=931626 RepID=H6LBN7_ACEWD|nr:STAS domain-containing protein [Acetobacterium woodii]AFA50160.1 putative anti-sigma factor antagonist [Acetobacterium woodii DSM 1030]